MGDGEIQRLDTVEIAGVHFMLAAHLVGFRLAQELAQRRHRPSSTSMQRTSMSLQQRPSACRAGLIGRGEEHDARHDGDMVQGAVQLRLRPHQGVGMDHDIHILELRQAALAMAFKGLAGGVRTRWM
jgi:hypothetical protein